MWNTAKARIGQWLLALLWPLLLPKLESWVEQWIGARAVRQAPPVSDHAIQHIQSSVFGGQTTGIQYVNSDETHVEGQELVTPYEKTRTRVYQGKSYTLCRCDPQGTWVYREDVR